MRSKFSCIFSFFFLLCFCVCLHRPHQNKLQWLRWIGVAGYAPKPPQPDVRLQTSERKKWRVGKRVGALHQRSRQSFAPADHTSGSLSVTLRGAALDTLRKDVVFLIVRYFSAAVNESVGTETSSRSSPDNPQLHRMNPPWSDAQGGNTSNFPHLKRMILLRVEMLLASEAAQPMNDNRWRQL